MPEGFTINQQHGNEQTPENTDETCHTSVEFTSWEETVLTVNYKWQRSSMTEPVERQVRYRWTQVLLSDSYDSSTAQYWDVVEMRDNQSDEVKGSREVLLRITDICIFLPSSGFAHSLHPLKCFLMLRKC